MDKMWHAFQVVNFKLLIQHIGNIHMYVGLFYCMIDCLVVENLVLGVAINNRKKVSALVVMEDLGHSNYHLY